MSEFLTFFSDLVERFPLHLEIYYSKIMDWSIKIYKKNCADDFPDSERSGNDAVLVDVQSCDMELCFAQAHVALKEWLMTYNGGY